MEKTEGFYSQPNSTTSIATTTSILMNSQKSASPNHDKKDQSISLEVPPQIGNRKSVQLLTTATSTTTLSNPDTLKRLRPELNTKETCKEELQSKTEVRKIEQFEETEDNPKTPQIQKQPRSRPENLQAQTTENILNNPDINTVKEHPLKMSNTETDHAETSTEIYPEIYPETRSIMLHRLHQRSRYSQPRNSQI